MKHTSGTASYNIAELHRVKSTDRGRKKIISTFIPNQS